MMRNVVILDPRDRVVKSYAIELDDKRVATEGDFILAARRLALKDRLDTADDRLRYVIVPDPQ